MMSDQIQTALSGSLQSSVQKMTITIIEYESDDDNSYHYLYRELNSKATEQEFHQIQSNSLYFSGTSLLLIELEVSHLLKRTEETLLTNIKEE